MAGGYTEHASAAIRTLNTEMTRVGAGNDGAVGDPATHHYGYHLSRNRLVGNGMTGDYSLSGSANNPVADNQAACAQDVINNWPAAREWIAWLFREYAAGRLPHVVEIIGSLDGKVASYAATSTNRKRVRYTGTGHVDWTHVAHGRRYCNVMTYGKELLGAWDANGLQASGDEGGSDMAMVTLSGDRTAVVVRGANKGIYVRVLAGGKPKTSWTRVGTVVAGSGVDAATRTGDDLWIVALDPDDKSVRVISSANAETLAAPRVQDIGGKGLGSAPGISASGLDILITVAGVSPHPGQIYLKRWAGVTNEWIDWVNLDGIAG